MSYKLRFQIGGLPKNINNSRGHWRVKHAENKKWIALVAYAVGIQRPPKPIKYATLKLTRASSVEPDFDGLVASFKSIIDGLIECKVLKNDRQSNIGQPKYTWQRAAPGKGFVEVHVAERRRK